MKVYGVIMAGGGGTRFWPLSRKENPKQLLNLSGKNVMVNETVLRLAQIMPKDDIYIVTNEKQADKTVETTKGLVNGENVLREPSARNTAACIGYAAVKIVLDHGDGVMVVTPSDAYIKDEKEYARVLKVGVKEAENSDGLITIGIKPTFPSTGYGYIQYEKGNGEVKPVLRFVEKPDEERAIQYLKSGDYAWNSGVFIWKASVILEKFREFLPDIYESLQKLSVALKNGEEIKDIYNGIRSISVDYGIMEKAANIKVIPAEFGWSDVGSWDMMSVLHNPDGSGNISIGNNVIIDSTDSTVFSQSRTVALVGLDDVVVVETPDAVLVCKKSKAQDVKKAVEQLKISGREDLL